MVHPLIKQELMRQLNDNELNICRIEISITAQRLKIDGHLNAGRQPDLSFELLKTFQQSLALFRYRRDRLLRDLRS